MNSNQLVNSKSPWNKGKLTGQKPPLTLHEIWSIHIRLEMANRIRELTLFNLAIDSKLKSCDLVKLRVSDIANMRASSKAGLPKLASTLWITEHTLCGEQKQPWYISAPKIYALSSFYSVIQNWKARFVIWALKLMMHWSLRNKLKFD